MNAASILATIEGLKQIHGALGNQNQQGRQNVEYASSVGQTAPELISQYRPQNIEEEQRMYDLRRSHDMMNEAYNDRRRQSNFYVDTAIAEQANRARAAGDVLNAYNNARNSTAQFISSLSGPGVTQR